MVLWIAWLKCICQLRPACSRTKTFFWLVLCLIGFTVRDDLMGVSSFMRALHLWGNCYHRLLDLMHSRAINLDKLATLWFQLLLRIFPDIVRVNGRLVILADGIKTPKEGRKMPAVKSLHQESTNNSKAEFIMGHSCQVAALLVKAFETFFAVPIVCRIHEGIVYSNRDNRTLMDKILAMLDALHIESLFYFVADAYYTNRKMIVGLMNNNQHLISRVKTNAIAYHPANAKKKSVRGRPKKYGKKIKLSSLFKQSDRFEKMNSPVYGEKYVELLVYSINLFWRAAGVMVKYVLVIHPTRGRVILMTTDLNLRSEDVVKLYGLRFKIEVSFKHTLNVIGSFSYHFWMRAMDKIKRRSGNQHLHKKTENYREAVNRKLHAYHCHIQLGLIAHGMLQYIACKMPSQVWRLFRSWIRTIRPGLAPSEFVVATAMKNTLWEFLTVSKYEPNFMKFIRSKIDFSIKTVFYEAAA